MKSSDQGWRLSLRSKRMVLKLNFDDAATCSEVTVAAIYLLHLNRFFVCAFKGSCLLVSKYFSCPLFLFCPLTKPNWTSHYSPDPICNSFLFLCQSSSTWIFNWLLALLEILFFKVTSQMSLAHTFHSEIQVKYRYRHSHSDISVCWLKLYFVSNPNRLSVVKFFLLFSPCKRLNYSVAHSMVLALYNNH